MNWIEFKADDPTTWPKGADNVLVWDKYGDWADALFRRGEFVCFFQPEKKLEGVTYWAEVTPPSADIVSLAHIFFEPWDRVKIAWRIIKTIW